MDDGYLKIPREIDTACKLPDPDTNVWRYLDFYKFESLLQESALYLRRADLFLQDKFEGTYPRQQLIDQGIWLTSRGYKQIAEKEQQNTVRNRKRAYISCWCLGDIDLDLMWKAYITDPPGVAIKSVVRALQQVCDTTDNHQPIDVSEVRYIDRAKEPFINYPGLEVFLTKDIHFQLDKELRIVHRSTESQPTRDGIFLPVNLPDLIRAVVLDPRTSDKDYVTRVKELLKEAGLKEDLVEFSRNRKDLIG